MPYKSTVMAVGAECKKEEGKIKWHPHSPMQNPKAQGRLNELVSRKVYKCASRHTKSP